MSLLALLWLSSPLPAHAEPVTVEVVSASDASRIRELIDDQIAAFQRDDAAGAWKHVSPGLRERFGTPEGFLRMVREGYRPVYRPRSWSYGELGVLPSGEVGQVLEGVGPDGERFRALYLLERQADGTWRTSGCLLFAPDDPQVAA